VQLGGSDATVPGDNHPLVVNEHGIGESEALNAIRNLPDLLFRVGPRIGPVGLQPRDCDQLHLAVGSREKAAARVAIICIVNNILHV
jgi:hypothetical protein